VKQPKPVTIDFETFGIEDRPFYPPIPVGVSIKYPGKKSRYYGFGHTSKNTCTWPEAKKALADAYSWKEGQLFQNGKFDVDVAEVHFGLAIPKWDRTHDTLFLIFLDDPHQKELGLKPAATRLLGWPEDEKDAVVDWLVENQPVPGVKISKSKQSEYYAMKYLAYAPGDLVGEYANGDVDRTEGIFNILWPKTRDRGMLKAYDRERQLMPILLEMERQGIPVDIDRLRSDVALYTEWMAKIDAWIVKIIKADASVNLDSGEQLVSCLLASGKADESRMLRTPTGKFQTNKEALLVGVSDKVLLGMLKCRASLKTCVNTFMKSWLAMAEATGGTIHTSWNQTRSTDGGTRTGRLSATWFMNIPKEFTPIWSHEEDDPKKAKLLPKCPIRGMPQLPKVRSYIIPFPGHVLIDRDYSQQEPRILAHFDGGALMESYLENPWVDFHDYAKEELEKMGKFYDRKPVKNTNLGLIYGMGVGKLAEKNGMPVEEAGELKKAILVLYPGLKDMYKDMRIRADSGVPIRTWGGREYYCEEPKLIDGRIRKFDYKLVNVLIQGSAADCTKEAIIRLYSAKRPDTKIILNVHDQLTASTPKSHYKAEMEVMRKTMESVEFDVPILSEGAISFTNWDELKDYDKKGKIL
jgi:DNA polymerase-1